MLEMTLEEITALPIATMEEWAHFMEKDGFYTAPEFLPMKFILKTLKRPPAELNTMFTPQEEE